MQAVKSFLLMCTAGAVIAMGGAATASAEDAVLLGNGASECEISHALGIVKSGCSQAVKKPGTRGLAIGNADQMQAPEPAEAAPAAHASSAHASAEHPSRSAAFQIKFEFGSAQLSEEATQILDRIGAVLSAPDAGGAKFRIAGHTDGVGSASRNQKLSEQRAESVKAYLTGHFGIDDARLEAVGKGSRELLDRSDPAAAVNRRVEITNLGS
jgi:outer membrane protein OmpA-like peptidoglycan-associated protein